MHLLNTTPPFIQGNIDCQLLEFISAMDARADIVSTLGDTNQIALAENVTVDPEDEPGSIALDSVPGNSSISNVSQVQLRR